MTNNILRIKYCFLELSNIQSLIRNLSFNTIIIDNILLYIQFIQLLIRGLVQNIEQYYYYNNYYLICVFILLNVNKNIGYIYILKILSFIIESIFLTNIMSYKLWLFFYMFYMKISRNGNLLILYLVKFLFEILFSQHLFFNIFLYIPLLLFDIIYFEYILLESFLNSFSDTLNDKDSLKINHWKIYPYSCLNICCSSSSLKLKNNIKYVIEHIQNELDQRYFFNNVICHRPTESILSCHFTIYLNYKSIREYTFFLYSLCGCFLFVYIYVFQYYLQNIWFAILNIIFFVTYTLVD